MLGAALKHRARLKLREQSLSRNPEGGYDVTTTADDLGDPFRCLFDPGDEGEDRSDGGIRRKRPATLMIGRRYLDGAALAIKAQDIVQLTTAPGFDDTLWEIVGNPKPIAKRRTIIGWTLTLSKVSRSD
jgi:hypothetical protein